MPPSWTHTSLAQQVVFGPGALRELPAIVRTIGARRALLVTTAGRAASPAGEQVVAMLGRSLESTFDEVTSHVPVPLVQQAVLQARRDGVDLVVSLGGGSCADLGKAVCFFLEQEAGMPGVSHLDRPVVPHVSIPTTYSGAELTPFFGMTDPATRQKQGAGGPTSAPVVAIYDPELTLSTPPQVSAETGMNALAHCVEASYAPDRSPEAEAVGLAGARDDPRRAPGGGGPAGRCRRPCCDAAGRGPGRALPAERQHGRPPRPGPARRGPHGHPPWPGQRDPPHPCGALQHGRRPRRGRSARQPRWAGTTPPARSTPFGPRSVCRDGCRRSGWRRTTSTPWRACRSRTAV